MSFLRSANAAKQAWVYEYSGLQIQSATAGVPIPIVYGTNKSGYNLIWQGGFFGVPQYSANTGSGGKGGSSNKQTVSGYSYYVSAILGLCEGPIAGIGTIWSGSSSTTLASAGWTFFSGSTPQPYWSVLSTQFPDQTIAYGGLAYVCSAAFYLGSSANLPSENFEIRGVLSFPSTSAVVNGLDADPALIVQDFLTNSQYGVGFPPESINASTLLGASGDASYQTYCRAAGLALSPTLVNQETANSILARWLLLTNAAVVWSGGELKFIPYGDLQITRQLQTGKLSTYTPQISPIYNLTDDDFVATGENDPVQVSRSDPFTAKNWLALEIAEREAQYSPLPIEAWDQNSIETFGLRKGSSITAHEICDPEVGQIAVQLMLQRGLAVRNTYQFKLTFEYCLLEPMDIVSLTDPALGLDCYPVRITAVEEDDIGVLAVSAEDFELGAATASIYSVQSGQGVAYNSSIVPAAVNIPLILEPPAALTGGIAQIWVALSGGTNGRVDPNWGGANIYVSLDDTSYSLIGATTHGPARQGNLINRLPAIGGLDNADVLSVSLLESGGMLAPSTDLDARNGATLSIIDTEFIAYANAVLTSANTYSLTGLQRGLFGSSPSEHLGGAPFARLDNAIFKYNLMNNYIGIKLYFKFQSVNIFGQGIQDLADCATYSYTPTGAGMIGEVTAALISGSSLDFGLASLADNSVDDWGRASDPYSIVIDLGLASA
ncbi:phage tail protein [Methylocapsa acidiphila]|uniref:phage tail protein n=1 Tax=Methylocapsa acidiphila TaxID=133552 RepID=UPI0004152B8A|nr:phage tail protein [Methylocapsa acidiphila]